MLSLSNAFDKKDLINFEKKILNYLNKNIELEYSVEPKIDGISASLTYLNGKLTYGVSRGDGSQGELITDNLKTIKDIPNLIKSKDFPSEIDIRGEVFIQNSDFKNLKEKGIYVVEDLNFPEIHEKYNPTGESMNLKIILKKIINNEKIDTQLIDKEQIDYMKNNIETIKIFKCKNKKKLFN